MECLGGGVVFFKLGNFSEVPGQERAGRQWALTEV